MIVVGAPLTCATGQAGLRWQRGAEHCGLNQGSNTPVRVLFVNTRSALGADVAVHITLMKRLGAAGCEVHLATNRRSADHAKLIAQVRGIEGLRIIELNLGYELSGRSRAGRLRGAAANLCVMAGALAQLAGYVRSRRIDVIHSTDRPRDALLSTLLARFTGRRNVLHLHIKWDAHMGRATTWAVRKSDGILAISEFVRGSLIDAGVPADRIYSALNATDAREFDPTLVKPGRLRSALCIGRDVPLVGIIARVMVWKGQLDLVEAFARVRDAVPDAMLAIIGNEDTMMGGDSYGEEVRRRIAELGLEDSVRWAGWVDDMPSAFADMDVVCVPSWEEPFGLVVTEAMAMRRPVVGYRSGALPEIVDEGLEGLLVPPRDMDALAAAIIGLLCDPERREAMGRRGRERVLRQFTPARQAEEVASIYRALCGKQA
jgi:glycosyltransferase involved in cell wall biosynthesis